MSFKDKEKRESNTVNLRKGFRRLTLLVSFLTLVFWSVVGVIVVLLVDQDVKAVPIPIGIGIAFFAGTWVVYWVAITIITPTVRWIVKGFKDGTKNPKET